MDTAPMSSTVLSLAWVVVALLALVLLQRWIHTHLHGVSLLLTGKPELALVIYTIVLFPGVLLHEASHWLMATLLGVRTGQMSLIPRRQPDGSLQLGYVEYYKSKKVGPTRESLIGAAPLLAGTAVILLIATQVFNVPELAAAARVGDLDILLTAFGGLWGSPFVILWVYLIFAVSNAMLPSKSDRRAWPAFFLILLAFAVVLHLIGVRDRLAAQLAGPALTTFGYLGMAFTVAVGIDLLFIIGIAVLERVLSRIRGVDVVYGDAAAE